MPAFEITYQACVDLRTRQHPTPERVLVYANDREDATRKYNEKYDVNIEYENDYPCHICGPAFEVGEYNFDMEQYFPAPRDVIPRFASMEEFYVALTEAEYLVRTEGKVGVPYGYTMLLNAVGNQVERG